MIAVYHLCSFIPSSRMVRKPNLAAQRCGMIEYSATFSLAQPIDAVDQTQQQGVPFGRLNLS